MGNVICCANDGDTIVETVNPSDLKRPQLFGAPHQSSSDENSSDDEHPLEERLRDLVKKIQEVKKQLELCAK